MTCTGCSRMQSPLLTSTDILLMSSCLMGFHHNQETTAVDGDHDTHDGDDNDD